MGEGYCGGVGGTILLKKIVEEGIRSKKLIKNYYFLLNL